MVVDREVHGERGATSGFAEDFDLAAVVLDDALNDHQPQPRAILFCRVVGLKESAERILFNADACVFEGDAQVTVGTFDRDAQSAAIGHGFQSVFDQIVERLFDLILIDANTRDGFWKAKFNMDISIFEFGLHKQKCILQEGIHFGVLQLRLLGADGLEELGDDDVEAGDLVGCDPQDIFKVVAILFFVQRMKFSIEQLQVDAQRIEGVSNFMRDTRREEFESV